MVAAVRQRVTVQPGGRVELTSPELPAGAEAEVIVLVGDDVPESAEAGRRVEGSTDDGPGEEPTRWTPATDEQLAALEREVAAELRPPTVEERLAALDALQRSMGMTPEQAEAWIAETRAERAAWRP